MNLITLQQARNTKVEISQQTKLQRDRRSRTSDEFFFTFLSSFMIDKSSLDN